MLVVRTLHATVRGAARCSCSPLVGGSSTIGKCGAKLGVGRKVACGATLPQRVSSCSECPRALPPVACRCSAAVAAVAAGVQT